MVRLGDSFVAVMAKRLSAVETDRSASHQHEFNGTAKMRQHLGSERRVLAATFIYLGMDDEERLALDEQVTWYDARERHPTRSEYRLYFRDNEVMAQAEEGDLLVAALRRDGSMILLVVDGASDDLPSVLWMFGISGDVSDRVRSVDPESVADRPLSVSNEVAELLGLATAQAPDDPWIDSLIERFGVRFPSTRELSSFALETFRGELPDRADPDDAILRLMDREEALFRGLERRIISSQIQERAPDWSQDVDAFLGFSLSVQNRRKSRAGHALEHHLEWIFDRNGLRFDHGVTTEGHSKPDFLFPGGLEYHDPSFPASRLVMLGAKTSCKDRWRQLLNEAARIEIKHLITLQPAVSVNQTDEMRAARVQLVIPTALHAGYSENQREWLFSLHDFIAFVRDTNPTMG